MVTKRLTPLPSDCRDEERCATSECLFRHKLWPSGSLQRMRCLRRSMPRHGAPAQHCVAPSRSNLYYYHIHDWCQYSSESNCCTKTYTRSHYTNKYLLLECGIEKLER